jgi:hypothetical protein
MYKTKLISFLLCAVLYSCTNENEFDYPLIQTGLVTNIDSTGATFHARITDLGNSDILEYGFFWSNNQNNEIESSERFLISGPPSTINISERITSTLEEGVVYYTKAFIRSSDYMSFGKDVAFTSMGSLKPVITDFFPKTGNIGDTLVIVGNNFSFLLKNNIVYFFKFPAEVIKAYQDSLFVIVPLFLFMEETYLTVSVSGNKFNVSEPFKLKMPVINDFNPKKGPSGSVIEITGNFIPDKSKLLVLFGTRIAEIISCSENFIRVLVPEKLYSEAFKIKVKMNNNYAESLENFQLDLIGIHSFESHSASFYSEIGLTGQNPNLIEK